MKSLAIGDLTQFVGLLPYPKVELKFNFLMTCLAFLVTSPCADAIEEPHCESPHSHKFRYILYE